MNEEQKYIDKNGMIFYDTAQKARLNKKVDKEEGKGLSSNDLTNDLKKKIEDAQPKGDYALKSEIPSLNGYATEDFVNQKGYQTQSDVEKIVDNRTSSAMFYRGEVDNYSDLAEKEATAKRGDMYNIKNASEYNKAGDNAAWNGSAWDILSGIVDLSGYLKTTDIQPLSNEEIEAILNS